MSPIYFKTLNSVCSCFQPASCQDQLPEAETMFLLSREVSGASSPSHRQSCGMAELAGLPTLLLLELRPPDVHLLSGTLQRFRRESNRDTQIVTLHPLHWPEAPRGVVAAIATGLFPFSHRVLLRVDVHNTDTTSWGLRQWPSLCHGIALFPEQAPSRPQFSKLPLAQSRLTGPIHWKDAINPEWKIPQNNSTWVAQSHSCCTVMLGQSC